jgi:inosine-uridine nucleoside N-ribohydrolase
VTGVGESHLGPGLTNICNLLNFGGQSAQVYAGPSAPTLFSNAFPDSFRQQIDQMFGRTIPPPPGPPGNSSISTTSSSDFLAAAFTNAANNGNPIDVLAIGGFTNLATLLDDPACPLATYRAGIGTIYAMAGAINGTVNGTVITCGGNVTTPTDPVWSYYGANPTAEWNVFIDPGAAATVIAAGLNLVLVPLNATNLAPVTHDYVDGYGAKAGNDVYAGFVHALLEQQVDSNTFFFDPLAAALLATRNQTTPPLVAPPQSIAIQVATTLDEGNNNVGSLIQLPNRGATVQFVVGTGDTLSQFQSVFSAATLPHSGGSPAG